MKVSDYKPTLYDNNLEMNIILNTEEQEFENRLKPKVENEFRDTFAKTATVNGIKNFEKILGIQADSSTQDLELRREIILTRLKSQIPFTERFFIDKLNDIIGEGNWYYTLDYNDYTLDINITTPGRTWLKELQDFLTKTIPCNIDWTAPHGIHIYAASWQAVMENFPTWDDLSEMTWQEVMDGEWL